MKISMKASGIAAVLSLLGVAMTGCGADVGDGAAGESADIGETAQAVVVTGVTSPGLMFPGVAQLPGLNKWISIGGYDQTTAPFTAVTTASIIDPSNGTAANRVRNLSAALPNAAGEVAVRFIEHDTSGGKDDYVFAVAGGRQAFDGTPVAKAYILTVDGKTLANANPTVTWDATNDLSEARVLLANKMSEGIKPCDSTTGKLKFIAPGGARAKGMKDVSAGVSSSDKIDVLEYDRATKSNSTWTNLVKASDHTTEIKLSAQHGYGGLLDVSTTDIRVVAGENASSVLAMAVIDQINLDSNCEAIGTLTANKTPILTALPVNRARFNVIKKPITIGAVTYDFAIVGGNDASAAGTPGYNAPTDVIYYKASTQAFDTTTADLGTGVLFPGLVDDLTNSQIKVVGGVQVAASNLFQTSASAVDLLATGTGARSAGTALANSRVGASFTSPDISGSNYAASGSVWASGNLSSYRTDSESF